jgi:branched-chain amino acid transport system permease protein
VLFQLFANGLINASVTALVATGFALIYNTTRIFHVAHGAVYVFAAYVYFFASELLLWPRPLAFLIATASAGVLGWAIEVFVYAPLYQRRASAIVCLLSSLGLYIVIVNIVAIAFGNQVQIARPIQEGAIEFGPVLITSPQILELRVAVLLLLPLVVMLRRSNWGRLIYATRDNPRLVAVMGVNLLAVRRFVFVVGSILAGSAGVLSVTNVGVNPQAGMPILLIAAVAVIVGGVGSFVGPVLGSIVVAILQSLAVWQISAKWSDAITFSVLILFMLFRPKGLLANRTRLEETAA